MTTFLILVALVGGGVYGHHVIAHEQQVLRAKAEYWHHRATVAEAKLHLPKPQAFQVGGVPIANLASAEAQAVQDD